MFDFQFECDNTITLIDRPPVVSREIKPVWAEELNILGIDRFFDYPKDCATPLLWVCSTKYYYRGDKVFEIKNLGDDTPPEVKVFPTLYQSFEPINLEALVERNKALLSRLADETVSIIQTALAENAALYDSVVCGFSGGKDSAVLLDLFLRAVGERRLIVSHSNTGMEFSSTEELVQRVFAALPGNCVPIISAADLSPVETWKMIGFPTQWARWCCKVHKSGPSKIFEQNVGAGRVFFLGGQRASESSRRAKYKIVSKGEMGEKVCSPLLQWNSCEIWLYVFYKNLEINTAYKIGSRRVGCVFCPMTAGISRFFSNRSKHDLYKQLKDIAFSQLQEAYLEKIYDENNALKAQRDGFWLKSPPVARFLDDTIEAFSPRNNSSGWLSVVGMDEPENGVYNIEGSNKKTLKSYVLKHLYCVGCGVCAAFCKHDAVAFSPLATGGRIVKIDQSRCVHCFECAFADGGKYPCFVFQRWRLSKAETEKRLEKMKNGEFCPVLSLPKAAEL